MIRHAVFFKFKPEISEDDRADFLARVQALPQRVPGILQPETGRDFLRTPRSYDVALLFGFADRAALALYQSHPNHIPVVERAKQICESIAAVDYEV